LLFLLYHFLFLYSTFQILTIPSCDNEIRFFPSLLHFINLTPSELASML